VPRRRPTEDPLFTQQLTHLFAKLSRSSTSNASVNQRPCRLISGMKLLADPLRRPQLPASLSLPDFTYSLKHGAFLGRPKNHFRFPRPRPCDAIEKSHRDQSASRQKPTPTTIASTSCRICSQISGSGSALVAPEDLAGITKIGSRRNAPGISSASRACHVLVIFGMAAASTS